MARTSGRDGIGSVQIPDFIDNSHPKTYEVLDHYLRTEPRADFASGYFNLGGYGLLRETLAEVLALRLLLSKEPGSMAGGELYPAGFQADLAGTEFIAKNTGVARELIELLREEKVKMRLFTEGFFHAKAYVFLSGCRGPRNSENVVRIRCLAAAG